MHMMAWRQQRVTSLNHTVQAPMNPLVLVTNYLAIRLVLEYQYVIYNVSFQNLGPS